MNRIAALALAALTSSIATMPTISFAGDSCIEEQNALASRIDTRGAFAYQLIVVDNKEIGVGDLVIGTCDGDTKKVVFIYTMRRDGMFMAGL